MVRWPNPKNISMSRIKGAKLAAARARHKPSDKKRTAWEFGELYWGRFATLFRNGVAILIVGFGVYILYQSVTQKVISIAPISVPKGLADSGYTADVAAERLQDALNDIVMRADSKKEGPDVAREIDLPSIVVPSTSLSTETLASQIRRFLRIENRSNVSGEITTVDERLWLLLRINGHDLYVSPVGVDPKHPDELFASAAEKVLEKNDPYILAASLFDTEPDKCLEKARHIIDSPPTDPMAPWAHTFMVGGLLDKMGLIDHSVAWAHTLVGQILRDKQDKTDEALLEYRLAVELDPRQAVHHTNLGRALSDQQKNDEVIAEYKKAIELDPRFANPHNNLGNALSDQGKTDEAIAEYKKAIELDPRLAHAHNGLGNALSDQGKTDEAIAEYKKAIDLVPRFALFYRNLSIVLRHQGKNDAADAELKKALDLEQKP
jgi:tetratricopeptide (TPR) repeat protein